MARRNLSLFSAGGFRADLPAPWGGPNDMTGPASKYTTSANWRGSGSMCGKTYPAFVAVLEELRKIKNGEEGRLAIGTYETPDGDRTVAEYRYPDGIQKEVATYGDGTFKCAKYDERGEYVLATYKPSEATLSGCAMFGAIMDALKEDEEFNELLEEAFATTKNDEKRLELYATLCDNAYRRCGDPDIDAQLAGVPADAVVKVSIPSDVGKIVESQCESMKINVTLGTFTIGEKEGSGAADSSSSAPDRSLAGLRALYGDPDSRWNEREKALIPQLDETVVISNEAIDAVKMFRETSKAGLPFNNLAFIGDAGSGKSTDAMVVAAILNKPFMVLSISGNTDESNIKAAILPYFSTMNAEGALEDAFETGNGDWMAKTSKEEIYMDPQNAYYKLSGQENDAATAADCFEYIIDNYGAEDRKFVYMLSPLVEALTRGYVVEVQEMNLCNDPSVLPVINEFLERGKIRLDNGKTLTRMEDAVAIFTFNLAYAGCNPINASILSRIQSKVIKNMPSPEVLKARIIAETGFTDTAKLDKMIETAVAIDNYCKDNAITDGTCGYRELRAWVLTVMYGCKDVYTAALSTIIPTASLDPASQSDIITAVLDANFAPSVASTRRRKPVSESVGSAF